MVRPPSSEPIGEFPSGIPKLLIVNCPLGLVELKGWLQISTTTLSEEKKKTESVFDILERAGDQIASSYFASRVRETLSQSNPVYFKTR